MSQGSRSFQDASQRRSNESIEREIFVDIWVVISDEQKAGLFGDYKGWNTTQLCGDYTEPLLGGDFKYVLFSPRSNLTNIFQMG